MSDFRFRRAERYQTGGTRDRMELAIPLPQSSSGMVSRLCPNEACSPRLFQLAQPEETQKIVEERRALIRRGPGAAGTTCPYCGCDAEDSEYTHPEDLTAIEKQVAWMFEQDVSDSLDEMFSNMASRFNRSSGGSRDMFSVRMDYEHSSRSSSPPRFYREDLLRSLTCDTCGRRYGVYAIALFCPDCGARNLHVHFLREVQLISEQVMLAREVGEENRELAYRLLGNAHEDVLTALETYLKVVYRFLVGHRCPDPGEAQKLLPKKLMFQNIEKAQKQFNKLGADPYSGLSTEDIVTLRLNIEKRHVIGHNLSIVDDAYSELDDTEQEGQTVRIMGDDIQRFAEVARKAIEHLETSSLEFLPSAG